MFRALGAGLLVTARNAAGAWAARLRPDDWAGATEGGAAGTATGQLRVIEIGDWPASLPWQVSRPPSRVSASPRAALALGTVIDPPDDRVTVKAAGSTWWP